MIKKQDYLSWSQYSLWQTSQREFWKRYGLGEDRSANKYFAKGRELGEALENSGDSENSVDELLSLVVSEVPKLDIMEYKVETVLSDGSKILSYIDSCDLAGLEFYEYKSGKIPWVQEKVDKHGQLLFYALSLYIASERTAIPDATLIWVETEQTENGLKYTGLVEKFERTFTIEEVEAFENELIKAIQEIEDFVYLELDLDDEVVDRYIEITEQIKKLQAEADLTRLEIQLLMEADDVKYASAKNGKFSISERKSWSYSEDLTKVQAEFAKQIKIAQAQEQKDGIAKQEVSTSLRFSLNK